MSHIRISIGDARVEAVKEKTGLNAEVCKIIGNKMSTYKCMEFSRLKNLSEESCTEYKIQNKLIKMTLYKKMLNSERVLIVVQAAYKTFKFPNYMSFDFIGKIIVDGIVVNSQNVFSKPDDNLLWEFM